MISEVIKLFRTPIALSKGVWSVQHVCLAALFRFHYDRLVTRSVGIIEESEELNIACA